MNQVFLHWNVLVIQPLFCFTFEQNVVLECVLGPVGTAHVIEGDKILEPGNGKFIIQFVDSSQHLVT